MAVFFAIVSIVMLVFFIGSVFQAMEMCYRIYKKDKMWGFNAVCFVLWLVIAVVLGLFLKMAGGV